MMHIKAPGRKRSPAAAAAGARLVQVVCSSSSPTHTSTSRKAEYTRTCTSHGCQYFRVIKQRAHGVCGGRGVYIMVHCLDDMTCSASKKAQKTQQLCTWPHPR